MATYIISLDPTAYTDNADGATSITNAGGTITKTYSFPFTYKVDIEEAEMGVLTIAESSLESESLTAEASYNIDHLKYLSNDAGSLATAYNPSSTGATESVYLIDTGVNTTHDEFTGATVTNLHTNFSDYVDASGHGTGMASLIVGQNIGSAPNGTLFNVKALDSVSTSATVGSMIDALDAILTHHNANVPSKTKTVCCCWTTSKNNLLDLKFAELEDNNLIVICAAGNDGLDTDTYSPAGLDRVMTVGSHNSSYVVGPFGANATFGSGSVTNIGEEVDIYTIGSNVNIASNSNTSVYVGANGTSISTAIIAGLSLQYIDAYPDASARVIKSYMTSEGSVDNRGANLTVDSNLLTSANVAITGLKKSVGVSPQVGDLELASVPSGLVLEVANGAVATANVEINSSASNVEVLAFSPTPPWVTWNNSGLITANTQANFANVTVPGRYHFAVKGTVSGVTLVEEYSIGVYQTDANELDTSSEFYYDSDNASYDQVVNFNATKGE